MRLRVANVEGLNLLLVRVPPCFIHMDGGDDTDRFFFFFWVAYENLPTKTYSSPNAFPSSLRSKRALVQNKLDAGEAAKGRDPVVSFIFLGMRAGCGCLLNEKRFADFGIGPRKMSKVWSYRS